MKNLSAIIESNFYNTQETLNQNLAFLDKAFKHHYKDYSPKEEDSLTSYSINSLDINHSLWEKHKNKNYPHDSVTLKHINNLDSALKKHKTPHKLTVYSGLRYNPIEKMNSKGIIHHPAYMSTSLAPPVSVKFGLKEFPTPHKSDHITHVLKIKVPKDHHGAYLAHKSMAPEEKEFLLPRGLNLKYMGTVKHEKKWMKKIHEHHMEIVK